MPNYVPGYGSPTAKLIVVGEAPGEEEDEAQRPFVGKTGKLVRQMLSLAGINPDDVYFTNVEKYRPPDNKLNRFHEIGHYRFEHIDTLWEEIRNSEANCILALGAHALEALCEKVGKGNGISVWRGSILKNVRWDEGIEVKVVSSYHPASILRSEIDEPGPINSSAIAYIQQDFIRAVEESKFKGMNLPQRELEVCFSADQALRFKKEYWDRGLRKVAMDTEATKGACVTTCAGLAFNKDHAMSFPLLNVADLNIPLEERLKIWKILAEIFADPDIELITQNGKYDWKKLHYTMKFKMPPRIYFDTAMAMHVCFPEFPKALEFQCSVLTREPFYKNELHEFDPQRDSYIDILKYNGKDCCVTYECYERLVENLRDLGLADLFFDEIMPLEKVYRELDLEGVEWDKDYQNQLKEQYIQKERDLLKVLDEVLGFRINYNSPHQLKKILYGELGLPERKDTKEDTLVALLANNAHTDRQKRFLNASLDIRKIRRTISNLESETDYDGKMRTLFNINAAATGRTGANKVDAPDRPTLVGQQFQNATKHGDIGPEIRKCYRPPKGKVVGQADSSQGEARIVAALAKDEYHLDLLRRGKDFYKIIASWFFGGENPNDPDEPLGITKDKRFIGKTGKLMLNYKAGKHRLMNEVNTNARKFNITIRDEHGNDTGDIVVISEREAGMYINIFNEKSPALRENYWPGILEAFRRNNKVLIAASGRRREFFGFYDPNLYYAYIPQASLTDNTKFALRRVKDRLPWAQIWLECHDSINWFSEEGDQFAEIAGVIKEELEQPVRLDRCSLPTDPIIIPCEIEIGPTYGDLEKYVA